MEVGNVLLKLFTHFAKTHKGRQVLCLLVALCFYLLAVVMFESYLSQEKPNYISCKTVTTERVPSTYSYLTDFELMTAKVFTYTSKVPVCKYYYIPIVPKNDRKKYDTVLLLRIQNNNIIHSLRKQSKIYVAYANGGLLAKVFPKLKNKQIYVLTLGREPRTLVPIWLSFFVGSLFVMMAFPTVFIGRLITIKNPARDGLRQKRLQRMREKGFKRRRQRHL